MLVGSKEAIEQLQQRIRRQYEDLTDIAYRLHAVFIHQGKKAKCVDDMRILSPNALQVKPIMVITGCISTIIKRNNGGNTMILW